MFALKIMTAQLSSKRASSQSVPFQSAAAASCVIWKRTGTAPCAMCRCTRPSLYSTSARTRLYRTSSTNWFRDCFKVRMVWWPLWSDLQLCFQMRCDGGGSITRHIRTRAPRGWNSAARRLTSTCSVPTRRSACLWITMAATALRGTWLRGLMMKFPLLHRIIIFM